MPYIPVPYERHNVCLCSVFFCLVCLFAWSVACLLSAIHCFAHMAPLCLTCLTSPVYPMYIWFRDRWQLPQSAQVTSSGPAGSKLGGLCGKLRAEGLGGWFQTKPGRVLNVSLFFDLVVAVTLSLYGFMGVYDAQMCPRWIQCVLNFKSVALIDAFRLDETQVTQCPTFCRIFRFLISATLPVCAFCLVCVCLRGLFFVSFIRLLSVSPVSLHQYIRCTFGFVTDGNCR